MPRFVELDERTTLSSQLDEKLGPVILINQFTVEPNEADQLLKAWAADAAWMKQQPGFISTAASSRRPQTPRLHQLRGLGDDRALQPSLHGPGIPVEARALSTKRRGVTPPSGRWRYLASAWPRHCLVLERVGALGALPSLRARDPIDPPAPQDERGTAGHGPGHRGRVPAALDHALDDPDLEGIVEAVPDVPVTQLVTAQARHRITHAERRR
jgi:hypothetical protein